MNEMFNEIRKPVRFKRVSQAQWEKDTQRINDDLKEWFIPQETPFSFEHAFETNVSDIALPVRGTGGAAGYDFVSTLDLKIWPTETIILPTGLRCEIDVPLVLELYPRSRLGINYGMQLVNPVGIVDLDYSYAAHEGHIRVAIIVTKPSPIKKVEQLHTGLFHPF